MTLRTALFCTLLATAATGALAQTPTPATPQVDARQQRQEARIQQGVASGALTGREARRLNHEQHAIQRAENRAKSDGVVTRGERARLHHMQDQAGRDIRRQKHDRQRAASAP